MAQLLEFPHPITTYFHKQFIDGLCDFREQKRTMARNGKSNIYPHIMEGMGREELREN
jgi:hypothetical protein